jgi:hypothetical protein
MSWYAQEVIWQEDLYFWGREFHKHFVAYSCYKGLSVLYAASDCQTRYLPAAATETVRALKDRHAGNATEHSSLQRLSRQKARPPMTPVSRQSSSRLLGRATSRCFSRGYSH